MMDILKLMYFSDLLGGIRHICITLSFSCFVIGFVILCAILASYIGPPKSLEKFVAKIKKYFATAFTVGIVSLCISVLIPSKDLRNIFVGTVAVEKAYENEAIKNLTDKVLTLVNQRLDALIKDKDTKGDKHD